MHKIFKKISFTVRIIGIGADLKSKIILFFEVLRIQKNFYTKGINKPFKCVIKNNQKNVGVNFRGTLDELHALTEIFIDRCYDPKTQVSTILDLGANIGLFCLWAHTEFQDCVINAYEPDPEVFKVLEINISQIPRAKSYNVAIADKEGVMEFYSADRSFSSSIYKVPSSKIIKVNTETIDHAISAIGNKVDLMKIDIEGAEFSAIKTATKLQNVNQIIGEIHPEKANKKESEFFNTLSKTHNVNKSGTGKSLFYAKFKDIHTL